MASHPKADDHEQALLAEPHGRDAAPAVEAKNETESGERDGDDGAPGEGADGEARKGGLSRRAKAMLVIGGLVAVVGGGAWGLDAWLHARAHESTNNATVQARTARVSPQVAGHALRVHVTDNQYVREGDLLVEVDARELRVMVDQARAQLAAAQGQQAQGQARVTAAEAALGEAKAQVDVAQAEATRAAQDADRYAKLSDLAATQQRREQVSAAAKTAEGQLAGARRKVASADAEIRSAVAQAASADAEVERARAGLRDAELKLSFAEVRAPFAGHVTQKRVEPGDYVRPGTPVVSLVARERWIEANFKETQLARMQPGQVATIAVDAYPDLDLVARVDSLQRGTGAQFALLPPQNATGNWVEVVQRLPVKLIFDDSALERLPPEVVLAPGLSLDVEVKIQERETPGELAGKIAAGARQLGQRMVDGIGSSLSGEKVAAR